MHRLPSLQLFQNALKYKNRIAIVNYPHNNTQRFTYNDLLNESAAISNQITFKKDDLEQDRVSFLYPQSFDYVRTQWGIWRSGGVAVPLSISHPPHELEYTITNSKSSMVLTNKENYSMLAEIGRKVGVQVIEIPEIGNGSPNKEVQHKIMPFDINRNAQIIYTSGTTSRPKGVIATHSNIEAQVKALVEAWEWKKEDHILEFLPLHHVHGLINILTCSLWSGAMCEMMPKFDSKQVIDRLLESGVTTDLEQPISLFMAVPTIYSKLIKYVEENVKTEKERQDIEKAFQRLRLMVSGSSALPETVKNDFMEISGHNLLERYGMTEIGMCLSNPLHGDRVSGSVGFPLPGVQVKINAEASSTQNGKPVFKDNTKEVGELLVKGPQVFKEYFEKKEATQEAFEDGWFKTGDIVEKDNSTGRFKILGRSSVDIIKNSGYKISALEIEREILDHPDIEECAVLGIPNEEYGQVIGAILVYKKGAEPMSYDDFKMWCQQRLAYYKVPKVIQVKEEIPKNAMLKVNKKDLVKLFTQN
ncbi:hypothetical protein DICPUDRAFT_93333 [Dictyostelium purpureum]|uniref:Uncharacterized protein n=1 Tax=Dictyostelium purpureum TaxID=5786 RepID=F1A5V9_DICPU|nr:uncharacterized protein DICPUDRAFT_93333 [Dictyostelium purpureum]EGC28424.1 hypothetical protein DICPUDRAFT_93333 [Dictyostelium purpureum]|eukprot:XP_003295051.1 hypothetical protein DICPUDRAFT_93333 [Dictyostelium purpureum]